MKGRLEYFNLDFTIWKASTPNTLIDDFYDLKPLQKACAQSHINICKHIVKNNINYTLILEDDACFDKDWLSKLNEFQYYN
jgi:GR25 family glycosyltransferase involved in LPS biosynthesis